MLTRKPYLLDVVVVDMQLFKPAVLELSEIQTTQDVHIYGYSFGVRMDSTNRLLILGLNLTSLMRLKDAAITCSLGRVRSRSSKVSLFL